MQNYNCTVSEYFSESGCYSFEESPFTPNCHLYCETDACQTSYNPEPGLCTAYICQRLAPSPSPIEPGIPVIPAIPLTPSCPVCENNIWAQAGWIIGATVSVLLICIALPLIVGLWKRTRRPTRRRHNDVESPNQNTFLLAARSSSLSSQNRTSNIPSLSNPHFSMASSSNSPTPRDTEAVVSRAALDEPAVAAAADSDQDVFVNLIDPFTLTTPQTVTLIPWFIPKLKSQECCSNDQMLASLLLQRCQLLLWLAQRKEHDAVRYYKLFCYVLHA